MSKWKIIVIGPKEAGKTLISNTIAEMSDSDYLRYEPTEGVRILEIEHLQKSSLLQNKNLEIELWDCAGSQNSIGIVDSLEKKFTPSHLYENVAIFDEFEESTKIGLHKSCWPVIQLDVKGVIFVYNPQQPELMSELELLYDYFVVQNGLTDVNCVVFINQRENNSQEDTLKTLSRRFSSVQKKALNAAGNPNGVRQQFSNFIESLARQIKTL